MNSCGRCARPARTRGLCETHYKAAQRAGLQRVRQPVAKAAGVKALAQSGENRRCVDCGGSPLFGGMRCLDCFQERSHRTNGVHVGGTSPSASWYKSGCRCGGCREAASEARRVERSKERA